MYIILFIAAIGCFVLAFYCGYWALVKVENAPKDKPHYEFAIKQLTMGAWTFGLFFVALLVGSGFAFNAEIVCPEPVIKLEDGEKLDG